MTKRSVEYLTPETSSSGKSSKKVSPILHQVPVFSNAELDIADLCARDLWRGKNFQTGKLQTSDEELMGYFAQNFYKLRSNINKHICYDISAAKALTKVTKIGMFNVGQQTNFKNGFTSIEINGINQKRLWSAHSSAITTNQVDLHSYGVAATKLVSRDFVKNAAIYPNKYRTVLASRMLFFAVPDMMLFNFSTKLAKTMGFVGLPHDVLPHFARVMEECLRQNWIFLYSYEMPFVAITDLKEEVWQLARNGGWWQRRVLDLALLIRFCNASPRQFLIDHLSTKPKYTP